MRKNVILLTVHYNLRKLKEPCIGVCTGIWLPMSLFRKGCVTGTPTRFKKQKQKKMLVMHQKKGDHVITIII